MFHSKKGVICIDDIAIMSSIATYDFPYYVVWVFPYELRKEKIFQDNLSHTLCDLKMLVEEMKILEANKRLLNCLKFDSQKEKQLKYVKENEQKISEIKTKMNEAISPYKWQIHKDFDNYWYQGNFREHIKADYLLVLIKE